MTLLAAIGDISRFPSARQLVGYAGMGTRVHDTGQTHYNGRITKAGRKDIRWVMVEAANHATRHHPHWKAEFARLEPRLGRNKAMVAIARKLLVSVWHVLTDGCVDRFAEPTNVARSLFGLAYDVGVANLPAARAPRASPGSSSTGCRSAASSKSSPGGRSRSSCRGRACGIRPSKARRSR